LFKGTPRAVPTIRDQTNSAVLRKENKSRMRIRKEAQEECISISTRTLVTLNKTVRNKLRTYTTGDGKKTLFSSELQRARRDKHRTPVLITTETNSNMTRKHPRTPNCKQLHQILDRFAARSTRSIYSKNRNPLQYCTIL
jgi:hypothetical protein